MADASLIIEWRQSLALLPDTVLLELYRMYRGEVQTPYHKSRLVEGLGDFLRDEGNRRTAAALLSTDDAQLLAAVAHLNAPTFGTLAAFFAADLTPESLRGRLYNLEERLLIFRNADAVFKITPYFADIAAAHAPLSVLLDDVRQDDSTEEPIQYQRDLIDAVSLAALLSFVAADGEVCKQDGSLRKKASERLHQIFADADAGIVDVVASLCATGLLRADDAGVLSADFAAWDSFAALPDIERRALLAAASLDTMSRQRVRQYASALLRLAHAVPPERRCSQKALCRLLFLTQRESVPHDHAALIDAAVRFGVFTAATQHDNDAVAPALSVDATFTVTVFGKLPLTTLVSLARFLDIVRVDTVCSYALTRASACRGFDEGLSTDDITTLLSTHNTHTLPQSVLQSLAEWYAQYEAVQLYHGTVLRVSPQQAPQVEKTLSAHLRTTLAPGVYLLDAATDAAQVLENAGIRHFGKVRHVTGADDSAVIDGFLRFAQTDSSSSMADIAVGMGTIGTDHPEAHSTEESADAAVLTDTLASLELSKEVRECLHARIERKVVLNQSQLRADTMKLEKTTAEGMDFLGKVYVLDYALKNALPVELTDERGAVVRGVPVALDKLDGDAAVCITGDGAPDEARRYRVGQLRQARRLRATLFREVGYMPY